MSELTLAESMDLNGRILNCKNAIFALNRVKQNIGDKHLEDVLTESERLILAVKTALEKQKIR